MSQEESEASFLNRWSSRKRGASTQTSTADDETTGISDAISMPLGAESSVAATLDTPRPTDAAEQSETVGQSVVSDEQALDAEELLLTDADMPPIESLTAESNVSVFFNKGVSATLRKAALRYVFQQPKFNVRDGLNDYDGDYTVFEPLGDIVTSDMKFHIARKERDRLAAEAEAERLEELLQQEQSDDEVDKEVDATEQAETDDEDEDKDQSALDDESSPQADEGSKESIDDEPSPESDAQDKPTTLGHSDSDDELPLQASMFVVPTVPV